jgi:hypothetical protein
MFRIIQSRCNQNGISLLKLSNGSDIVVKNKSSFQFCVLRNIDQNLYRLKASNLDSIFYKRNEFLASDDIEYAYKQLLQLCITNNSNSNKIDPTNILIVDDVHSKYAFIFKKDMFCSINH